MKASQILTLGILAGLIVGLFAIGLNESFGQSTQLPPGHPPVGGQDVGPRIPATPGGQPSGHGLTWTAPRGWTSETPASSMRRAQYRIPGPAGPGECAVFYFGPGQGGDAQSNAARWAAQFRTADGKPVTDAFTTHEIKVGDVPVLLVEVAGTYVGGMGGGPPVPERPNYMLLGAIAKGPDANWFFRATGPRATMEAQRAAFEGMIRSLKRGSTL